MMTALWVVLFVLPVAVMLWGFWPVTIPQPPGRAVPCRNTGCVLCEPGRRRREPGEVRLIGAAAAVT